MTLKIINIYSTFNWQVQKAARTKNKFFIEQACLNRELFLISKDLTIDDWRKIRTQNYYIERDQLTGNKQMEFIINSIKSCR